MAEIKAPLPESPPPRRPWYRLHLSTRVVLYITAGILALLIVPGEMKDSLVGLYFPNVSESEPSITCQHGWPWQYLERHILDDEIQEEFLNKPQWPPWLIFFSWNFYGSKIIFSPVMLLLDIFAAASILFLVAFCFEWRRRRRWRIWQFTLFELLLLTAILAGVLGWWRTNHVRTQKEQDIVPSVNDNNLYNFCSYRSYHGPVFLEKLLGKKYLSDFFTVTNVTLCHRDTTTALKDFSVCSKLPNIEFIVAEEAEKADIKEILKLPHLKTLVLIKSRLTDDDFASIAQISSFEKLCLDETPITSNGILALQSSPHLEGLILDGCPIGDESARALAHLDNLQYLCIRESLLSDSSVSYLGNLTRLKELYIQKSNITPHGYERLRMLLPHCKISYESEQDPYTLIPGYLGGGFF